MAVAITRRLPVGFTELPCFPPGHFKGASIDVLSGGIAEREAQGIFSLRGKQHTTQVRCFTIEPCG